MPEPTHYMSITTSSSGREQQINRLPAANGGSAVRDHTSPAPEINPHSQVWQTPARQDHAHRDVTGFGEFQQALELLVPANRKPGAGKGNSWAFILGMR